MKQAGAAPPQGPARSASPSIFGSLVKLSISRIPDGSQGMSLEVTMATKKKNKDKGQDQGQGPQEPGQGA